MKVAGKDGSSFYKINLYSISNKENFNNYVNSGSVEYLNYFNELYVYEDLLGVSREILTDIAIPYVTSNSIKNGFDNAVKNYPSSYYLGEYIPGKITRQDLDDYVTRNDNDFFKQELKDFIYIAKVNYINDVLNSIKNLVRRRHK